ncbi:histidinol dehydrogenase [Brachybacterium sp. AOP42-C2-15]|uniref:histidinol dehydrogenase n=1 Tax=Brachybacterium sp. AOP42-C2-15 TaxID=3457670 RepID=UPI00403411BC
MTDTLTNKENPLATTPLVRERGTWSTMTTQERDDLFTRGTAAIFDPTLREGILEILADVREHGDDALVRALKKFDGVTITPGQLRVSTEEIAAAVDGIDPTVHEAIRTLIRNLRAFNEQVTKHGDWSFEVEPGLTAGEKVTPIASAGLFVPSGKGSFPSVLCQIAVPAVVAGVPEIAVVVPPIPGSAGEVDPAVLVVAHELGITNIFRSNGPAGIAALAFGTESVPRVRKVTGPGSPAVTLAQLEVQALGTVSTTLLGPSESLLLADSSARPDYVAADLLNEAEHGPDSTSVFVTDSPELLTAVQAEVATQLAALPEPRRSYAAAALGTNGGVVLVDSLEEGAEVVNGFAPEHMQLVVDPAREEAIIDLIVDAGEILVGHHITVSMGNFSIGIPASLPTSGWAKVSSGITADAFRKRTAIAHSTPEALARATKTVLAFSEHEGFPAHAASILRRSS